MEYVELFSQVAFARPDLLTYVPQPTDIVAARSLLPDLVSGEGQRQDIVVFASNEVFGADGLNNFIPMCLESSTATFVHLVFSAAATVDSYACIGQPHRAFGVRTDPLSALYDAHAAFDDQVSFLDLHDPHLIADLQHAIRHPLVRIVRLDMGAMGLTNLLHKQTPPNSSPGCVHALANK